MLLLLLTLLSSSPFASAEPPISQSLQSVIPGSESRYAGIKGFKMVMPGVLYRGGSIGGKSPLGSSQLNALCADGFTSAIYVYKTGWPGEQAVNCGHSLSYTYNQWDRPASVRAALTEIYQVIKSGRGAVYVHCWFGVHASGYVVTAALKQFCGISDGDALNYWNSNVAPSIQYDHVQRMVLGFEPYPDLTITAEERARVCPSF